jgi:hypothetical protein
LREHYEPKCLDVYFQIFQNLGTHRVLANFKYQTLVVYFKSKDYPVLAIPCLASVPILRTLILCELVLPLRIQLPILNQHLPYHPNLANLSKPKRITTCPSP